MEYMNARSAQIRWYSDYFLDDEEPPDAVTVVKQFPTSDVDTQELPQIVRQAALNSGIGGYQLEDRKRYFEMGASGAGQEVILWLISMGPSAVGGAAGGVAGALAQPVTQEILQWFRQQPNKGTAASAMSDGVLEAKQEVGRIYRVREDDLDVAETIRISDGILIKLIDKNSGTSYSVRMADDFNIVHIEKV
jgi:hypothetical protein